MKDDILFFVGADLVTTIGYIILQDTIPDFVLGNTIKVFAAIFVGFIGGFFGVIGKRVAEDYFKQRKQKRDANKRT